MAPRNGGVTKDAVTAHGSRRKTADRCAPPAAIGAATAQHMIADEVQ